MTDNPGLDIQPLASAPLLNRTDPIVRHDPSIKKSVVVKHNISDKTNSIKGINTGDFDMKKVDGVAIPILRIGNLVIDTRRIKYMFLDYKGFVPNIVVTVTQVNKSGEINDVPGMNCDMTLVLLPQVDGAYKPISIDFYVRDIKYSSYEITYYGTYKLMKLDKPQTKQMQFCPTSGCAAKYCQLPYNPHPTTYEFLHDVAIKDLGLGLAATKQVKEIKDDKYRFLHSESYFDAIQKHVAYAGKDKDSIFDCWIDLYRYLVIVNIPYIMKEDVKPNEIGYRATLGIDATNSTVGDDIESNMIQRIITNYKQIPALSNIGFTNYKFEVDNSEIQDEGSITSNVITNPIGVKDGNNDSCDQTDIRIQELSVDGQEKFKDYSYRKQKFMGPEFGNEDDGNTPILIQKQLHDSYLRRMRAKRLVVEMNNPNLGLQRGTLVNVAIYEYHNQNKRTMVANATSIPGDKSEAESDVTIDKNLANNIDADGYGFINPSVSGMYYIDGMTFEYEDRYQKFVQRLYLIRKGFNRNLTNFTSYPKISE